MVVLALILIILIQESLIAYMGCVYFLMKHGWKYSTNTKSWIAEKFHEENHETLDSKIYQQLQQKNILKAVFVQRRLMKQEKKKSFAGRQVPDWR